MNKLLVSGRLGIVLLEEELETCRDSIKLSVLAEIMTYPRDPRNYTPSNMGESLPYSLGVFISLSVSELYHKAVLEYLRNNIRYIDRPTLVEHLENRGEGLDDELDKIVSKVMKWRVQSLELLINPKHSTNLSTIGLGGKYIKSVQIP